MNKGYKDPMGERIKQYEACSSTTLIDGTPKVIRLDGKAFHSWVKKADTKSPFDQNVITSIANGAIAIMNEIGGIARFAYIQSDECTIVLNDKLDTHTQPWFGNKVQKITSITAAMMSVHFTNYWRSVKNEIKPAYFDSRVFEVPTISEMHNTVLWRQFDAAKNSISQYARNFFSHKQLHGKNTNEMQDMMMLEKGFNWNDAPTWTKRGIIVKRIKKQVPYISHINGREETIERSGLFVDWDIPMFNKDQNYLRDLFEVETDNE